MFIPELGTIVAGKYRLVRQLGEGGMATVFEVENTITLKRAALKWVHPQFSDPERGASRVVHEARATSRIHHENVVNVYDVIEDAGSIFLIMELLEGEPLSALLKRVALPIHALIELLLPALRGVSAAHAAGVVHRDIKPDNIFLAKVPGYRAPVPKVIDFGISKMFESGASDVTRSGITMGTPRYVSYEQLLGARDVDARTDIYAFGVIFYEALTGQAPYPDAHTFGEQAVCFATQEPAAPAALRADLPIELDRVVVRAIAKQRDERYASMDELITALEPFADAAQYQLGLVLLSKAPASSKETKVEGRASVPTSPQQADKPAASSAPPERAAVLSRASLPAGPIKRGYVIAGVVLLVVLTALGVLREPVQTTSVAARKTESRPEPPAAPKSRVEAPPPPPADVPTRAIPEADRAPMAEPLRMRPQGARRRAGAKLTQRDASVPSPHAAASGSAADAQVSPMSPGVDILHRAGRVKPTEF